MVLIFKCIVSQWSNACNVLLNIM